MFRNAAANNTRQPQQQIRHSLNNNRNNNNNKHVVLSTTRLLSICVLLICALWLVFTSSFWQSAETQVVVSNLERVGESALSNMAASNKLKHPSLLLQPLILHKEEQGAETSKSSSSWTTVSEIRAAFHHRYDTAQQTADDMYHKAVAHFGKSIEHTAIRLLQAAARDDEKPNTFSMGFAGYSVTVGRGNHLEQSFPYIARDLLRPILYTQLNLHLHVRNAAIGGIPSFPYGFCLSHFLGNDADVVSWDYSMNEQGKSNTAALEAYIRHAQRQMHNNRHPLMIVLDNHVGRCNLLKDYVARGLLGDALCLHKPEDAVDDKSLLDKSGKQQQQTVRPPEGFQHWDEFGAPPSCPGRGNWHPRKQEHAWMGWMITMYFVDAIELALQMIHDKPGDEWKTFYGTAAGPSSESKSEVIKFPSPLSKELPENDADVTDLLFGHKTSDKEYVLKEVSCRTNFLPASDHDNVLPQIVVSGLSPEAATADDIIHERGDDVYRQGWVLDISSLERKTKIKVEECGGLGYVDMKIAIYGVPESGVLRLWLPVESTEHMKASHQDHNHDGNDLSARHWFDTLVICEANEKRADDACQLDKDLEYTVGGVSIPIDNVKMIMGAGEYLKRPTCAHVGIPVDAKMTALADLKTTEGHDVDDDVRIRLSSSSHRRGNHNELGLIVDLQAKPNVSRKQGACCVSHVVWEQH